MTIEMRWQLRELTVGATALLVFSGAAFTASARAVVTVSMPTTTVTAVVDIAAQHERTGGRRTNYETLVATVPARGFAPATKTTGRVSFSYEVLVNLVAPWAQANMPHPTVRAGTVVYDCRRISPCPKNRVLYRTTRAAVLDRRCSSGFFSTGWCSQVVPIVAERVGPSDLGGSSYLRTTETVSFPGGGREPITVTIEDSGTPGRWRTPIVTSSDRDAAVRGLRTTLRAGLERGRVLVADRLVAQEVRADRSEYLVLEGTTVDRGELRRAAERELRRALPAGSHLLTSTVMPSKVISDEVNSVHLAVQAQAGALDERGVAQLVRGSRASQASKLLAAHGITLVRSSQRYPWPPWLPAGSSQIRVVLR